MVLGLEGHIMARYSEWRVLGGGDSALGREGVLEGADRERYMTRGLCWQPGRC
jgi:hypothetical protein